MPELDQNHIDNLHKYSIVSWFRIYVACGFAFTVTFLSTLFLGSTPMWNAITGIGILFSIIAVLYAALAIGLTTYFEASARKDYANSLFAKSSLPLEMFILKDALRASRRPPSN